MQHYLSLLLVASLLHITTSTAFYVMPDNHYHPISDNTHTLQHYLNNTNKYFTSNTQLHFLPGQHYLNNDFIIQGVSNFSLIGNRTNEVINTVINCTLPAGVVVVDSSNIVIANIVMNECGNDYTAFLNDYLIEENNIKQSTNLLFLRCKLVTCIYFYSKSNAGGIRFINPLVNTNFSKSITNHLVIRYDKYINNTNNIFYINNIQFHDNNVDVYSVQIKQFNMSSNISVTIQHVHFTNIQALHITCVNCTGHSLIILNDCSFTSNPLNYEYYNYDDLYDEHEDDNWPPCEYNFTYYYTNHTVYADYQDCINIDIPNSVQFINCYFVNNFGSQELIHIKQNSSLKYNTTNLIIVITDCIFHNNWFAQFLSVDSYNDELNMISTLLLIKNTQISSNMYFTTALVSAYQTKVEIDQVKVISNVGANNYCYTSSIFKAGINYLQFQNYNEFFNNTVDIVTAAVSLHVQENSILNFTLNIIFFNVIHTESTDALYLLTVLELCPIQYVNKKGNMDKEFQRGDTMNYSIIFNTNNMTAISNTAMMHCTWDSHSAFSTTRPALVNKKFVDYNFNNDENDYICLCQKNKTKNCHNKDFGPLYPGQKVGFNFVLADHEIKYTEKALISIIDQSDITCKYLNDKSLVFELQNDECKTIEYNVKYNYRGWCELSLEIRYLPDYIGLVELETYSILLQLCPKGFSLHLEGDCQCDQILSSYIPSITHCNIDDQTIPRPANSWISAHTVNNSHSYQVSLHCPFDYCLPHPSHLNLSTSDSQCQFNRSSLLCGQCQQGLSAVFGSSQCKQCSNVYLLIIIPIGIAGLILVLLLFVLNLTVTDGNINPFLLCVNIISINTSTIFPTNTTVVHTFISLSNLDLGIQTCFYDGMDEYTKRWLQLAFPAYLIFIAMLIIITSRYYTRMQRLTARRALPVLATLFLLSYTKVLLTITTVLFYYSSISYLPSNHTVTMWAADTSVLLFGVKFTILFITCLLIFVALIPFNIVLIFTRTLSYFRVVNYFKPLLDAYQGPYKIKFYYWTGLQLVVRAIFFGLSALDREINLMISIILLGVIICLQNVFPFIKKINNTIEILSLLNLQVIFVIAYFMPRNDIMINFAISLLMLQLICIIALHVKVAFCDSSNFTEITLNKLSKRLLCFGKQESRRQPIQLNSVAPEVMYNYKEFQEPLIGQD